MIRDKSFMEYVDKIGQNYFGVPPPERARPGGIFGGFFDSFVNMLNDDDDESEDDGAAAAARRYSVHIISCFLFGLKFQLLCSLQGFLRSFPCPPGSKDGD